MKSNAEIQELIGRIKTNNGNAWIKGVKEHMARFKRRALAPDHIDLFVLEEDKKGTADIEAETRESDKRPSRIISEMSETADAISETQSRKDDIVGSPKEDFHTFSTGAVKQTGSKLRLDLVRPSLEEGAAEVLGFGASKYGDRNWEKGIPYLTVLAATRRHINKFIKGEDVDHESGLNHIKHAACNLAFLLEFIEKGRKDLDNRGN